MEPLQHGLLQEKDCNPSLIIHCSKSPKQATAKQLPLPPEQAALVREATHPVCWDNVTAPLWHQPSISLGQKPKSKHKMRRIPCSSFCSITCRAVRESLTYSDNQFITGESILPWHPPSEELYPLCPKKLFGFCDIYHKLPVLQGFTCNPFLQRNSIQNRRYLIPHPMLLLLLCFSRGKHTFKLWLAHETMDNRPLANTFFRRTCNFRHNWECIKFCLHHEFALIYYKFCVLESIQNKSILLSCAKILLYLYNRWCQKPTTNKKPFSS